jgi:flagellar motor switch protein FliM
LDEKGQAKCAEEKDVKEEDNMQGRREKRERMKEVRRINIKRREEVFYQTHSFTPYLRRGFGRNCRDPAS